MIIFFDNTLSKYIPQALTVLGEHACHLQDHFPEDTQDIMWLPFLYENKMGLITLDLRISKQPLEIKMVTKYKIKTFFLEGKNLSGWSRVLQVFKAWDGIKQQAIKHRSPHIYKVTAGGRVYKPEQL